MRLFKVGHSGPEKCELIKSVFEAFLKLQFWFVIFCQKNIGATAAGKMLVKLATGIFFTNILQAVLCTKVFWTAFL